MTAPSPESAPPAGRWARLNRTDRLAVACNALLAVLVIAFAARIPRWPLLLGLNLGMLALIPLVVPRLGAGRSAAGRALRAFYPVLFVWAAYAQTGAMNQIVRTGFIDEALRALDARLFGCDPATAFAAALPHPAVAEVMHGLYFSYYLLFPGLALGLHFAGKARELDDYLSTLCGAFYACCLAFIFLPAVGPVELKAPAAGRFFPQVMDLIYRWFEQPGGAFPSSHVVIALIALAYARRHAPRWSPVFLVGCLGVLPATVYCQYHYAVDVLAGTAVAGVALFLARGHFRPSTAPA